MSFPFHYSRLNYELANSSPSDSINIFWNQMGEKMKADSIMYMTPNFDPSIGFTYPEFGLWGNNLLNPMLAIQQTMQSFQNGSWMNGMNNGGNWFNNMPWNNWTMPWNNNNGNNGGSTVSPEYDALKAVLNKYKENNPNDTTANGVIQEALNKSGTADEKLQALKDAYKKLNKTKLEKALLDLPEYKNALINAGYSFKSENTALSKDLNGLKSDIQSGKGDQLVVISKSETNPEILRIISTWNDKNNSNETRGIIRLVANNIPQAEDEQKLQKQGVTNLAMSLINKAEDLSGEYPKLDAAKEAVSKALVDVNKDKGFTKANLNKLAEKFDTLYAMLRLMEAEKTRNEIQTKYNFLNNISSTDVDFVTDDLVVKSTIEDLKAEGITIPAYDHVEKEEVDDIPEDITGETVEEQLEDLVTKNHLEKTNKEGVFKTKTTSADETPRFYMIKGDKLVELTNVRNIDENGKCTMVDGSEKELKDVKTKEVTAEDARDYNETLKRINSLSASKIQACSTKLSDGTTVYRSKGKKLDGNYQYFVIRNNKLMQINGIVQAGGSVKIGNENKAAKDLKDSDFTEITDSAILAEDETEEVTPPANEDDGDDEPVAAKPPVINESAQTYTDGQTVYSKLSGSTNDTEWTKAKEIIEAITADTVRNVIAGYESKRSGIHMADCILEQIAEEWKSTGFLGGGHTMRQGRKDLINHIIKAVLDYCEKYPELQKRDAYTKLKDKYNDGNGITAEDVNKHSESTIRELDHYILDLLDINR